MATKVDPSGKIRMEEHIKIPPGGTPAPRIHFYDDTGGRTKKIHIGWVGAISTRAASVSYSSAARSAST